MLLHIHTHIHTDRQTDRQKDTYYTEREREGKECRRREKQLPNLIDEPRLAT